MKDPYLKIWGILDSLARIIIGISIIIFLSNYLTGILFYLTTAILVWWVLDHIVLMSKIYFKEDKKRKK